MSFTCPNGHQSETGDYCDQCGARIQGAPSTAPPSPTTPATAADPAASAAAAGGGGATGAPGPAPAATRSGPLGTDPADPAGTADPAGPAGTGSTSAAANGDQLCPVCATPRVGDDRFCEVCGYDFTTQAPGTAPGAPILAAVPGTTSTPAWEAVAVADRNYFDRVAPEGVTFPLHCPPRTFLLAGDQIRIGRHSNSRGIQPEVDLAGAPEDGAISHLHCILLQQPDGSYSVVDPGSTNGTTMNDDPTPLMANIAVALADGDRIHVGAWTTITIRAHPSRP
jgi:FHA domain